MRRQDAVDCEVVERELSSYIDGETGEPLRHAIELHLLECRWCSAAHDGMRRMLELFRDAHLIEVPEGYCERLHAFLTERMGK